MAAEAVATRRRFTRAEYYQVAEVGILGEHDRVELIDGEIVEMSPTGRRHGAFVDNLTELLIVPWPVARLCVSSSVALSDDPDPQPGLTVLRRAGVSYKERDASAGDAVLVIEVADSSLAYDRSTKMRLYAEDGIPEYWEVNCAAETVEVHRQPGPDGYRDVRLVAGVATVALQAFPDVRSARRPSSPDRVRSPAAPSASRPGIARPVVTAGVSSWISSTNRPQAPARLPGRLECYPSKRSSSTRSFDFHWVSWKGPVPIALNAGPCMAVVSLLNHRPATSGREVPGHHLRSIARLT